MEKSKLIQILRTFDKKELRRCKDFVHSPYFNKNKEVIRLYDYLFTIAPHFPPAKIEKERLYAKVFGKKSFDKGHLHYVSCMLVKLLEQFLGQEKYESSNIFPKMFALNSYLDKDISKSFESLQKRLYKEFSEAHHKSIDSNFYYNLFYISDIEQRYYVKNGLLNKADEVSQKTVDSLDDFYFASKLRYSYAILDRQHAVSYNFKIQFLEEVLCHLKTRDINQKPFIQMYYHLINLLKDKDDNDLYLTCKEYLLKHQNRFSKFEIKELYLFITNYCILRFRAGDRDYFEPELLQLYSKGIENGALLENEYIEPSTFTNTVRLGLNMQKNDWVKNFISRNSSKIKEEFRETVSNFNLAALCFEKKDYDMTFYHLNQMGTLSRDLSIIYSLGRRMMYLKMYYELGEFDPLEATINSFLVYLKRDKTWAKKKKSPYHNFVLILNMMINTTPDKVPKIRERINNTQLLTTRGWLLEQCDKLEGKRK